MSLQPSSTVTFLFTDIEGSTRLWESFPDVMRGALQRHDAIVRASIEAHGGEVFKTIGDAFCAAFGTAHDAVEAAVEAQRRLLGEDWNELGELRVRMSLHSGEAEARDDDFFGPTVNRVARLMATAHGGQILLSAVTGRLIGKDRPTGLSLLDLGEHRLQDLGGRQVVFQVLHPDLASDFPPIRSLAAFPNNLPLELSSFVGREEDLEAVEQLLDDNRLLTLTGIGGTGKTRLAIRAAADRFKQHADGVWLVALAPLADPALVPHSVASALGLREESGRSIEATVRDHLGEQQSLLVLDNCEHLVHACAELVDDLLRSCPKLSILATSREPLGILGEVSWPVPPLALPDPATLPAGDSEALDLDALASSEAVRLFVERAASVKLGFELTQENARAILEICRRLDGLALALELAATRVRAMTPRQIAERLSQRFRLLTGGSRTALPHHQTLRATLDWSYELLDARERCLFRRLSIFSDGWTLESAEAVCSDAGDRPEDIPEWEVLDLFGQLVDKSLASARDETGRRHAMLETVQDYGREKLRASGEQAAIAERHARHFQALAEEAGTEFVGSESHLWLERLDAERANLRRARDWAIESTSAEVGLSLAGSLWRYWFSRGHFAEGCEALEQVLSFEDPEPTGAARARALHGLGTLLTYRGEFLAARSYLEEGLAVWRAIGDDRHAADTAHNLAIIDHEQGNFAAALPRMRSFLDYVSQTDDHISRAQAHNNVATLALELGNLDAAQAGFEEGLRINRKLDNASGIAYGLRDLGATALDRGDFDTARRLLEKGIESNDALEDKHFLAESLCHLGEIAHRQGNIGPARQRFEESLALEEEMGNRRSIAMIHGFLGHLALDVQDHAAAERHFESSLVVLEEIGHKRGLSSALNGLGRLALLSGDLETARGCFRRSLELRQAMGSPLHVISTFESLVSLAVAEERPAHALHLAGAADALRSKLGAPLPPVSRPDLEAQINAASAQLDEARAKAALTKGAAMQLEAALTCALELLQPSASAPLPVGLTVWGGARPTEATEAN